jgi:chromosome segregation protein
VVQPPGKNLQSVTLLSGGEKAMTAITLLFAIYKTKPSPFCVLDEIDAPLDDANVQRFGDLVVDFTQDSQFIIITHNKGTMEISDSLYGVTMQEKGVSSIVSIEFDERGKPMAEAFVEDQPAADSSPKPAPARRKPQGIEAPA